MKKKFIFLILLITIFCTPLLVTKAETKNGWIKEDGNTYYYINGERVKGFQEIEGKTYFFSNVNYALKTGIQYIDGQPFYLNEDGTVYHGWKEIDGKTYYFGGNHYAIKGFQEIEGKTYFFSNVNYALKTGIQYIDGQPFYLNEGGTVYHGWKKIDGKTYYFGDNHYGLNEFQTIDGKNYYFNNYVLQTGIVMINDKLIYANDNGEIQYGWQTINNNKYYFGEDGYAVKGFQEIEGKTYFFSNINYVLKSGWQTLSNDNSQIFYLNMDGSVVYGNQTIEGRDYAFGDDGFLDGFKNIGNTFVYYNPDGTIAKGIQRMAGKYYQFNEYTGAFEKYVNQRIVIDVSSHQGMIDWEAVKNSGMVDAVILRAGYGVSWTDTYFQRNVQELNRLGIPYSVYLFSYAENANEASMEADNLINIIKNNGANIASNIFSIYYDLEDWTISSTGESDDGISPGTYQEMFDSFSNKVETSLGIDVKIYASKSFIETRFPTSLRPEVGWVAQWGPELTYDGTYEGWQYTSDGSIPGINGRVDMSVFYY